MDEFDLPGLGASQPKKEKPTPEVFSVTDVTRKVRGLLENTIGDVWVEGEVSNLRRQASGHTYFTLKDSAAQLSCVLFRGHARFLRSPLAEGTKIQAMGGLTVYEARGQYQLVVRLVKFGGQGSLHARFEALKQQLAEEGLFDSALKKPIKKFPAHIAIVTSPTSAAVRDILNVLRRRAPWVRVTVFPVRVQGQGAEKEIAASIAEADDAATIGIPPADTIIVGRGGGSIEDLWNFNEEVVARAIAASKTPVISAVGHEIDFTIADFAADLRAPTPSAAAELAVPDRSELEANLASFHESLDRRVRTTLSHHRKMLELTASGSLRREPLRALERHTQTLDLLASGLASLTTTQLDRHSRSLQSLASTVAAHRPDRVLDARRAATRLAAKNLNHAVGLRIHHLNDETRRLAQVLSALGPSSVFARGFSMTLDARGKPVTSADSLSPGDTVTTKLHSGAFKSTVDSKDPPTTTEEDKKTR